MHAVREPQVGNAAMESFVDDPDGYKINFYSPTDLPEGTLLSEIEPGSRTLGRLLIIGSAPMPCWE